MNRFFYALLLTCLTSTASAVEYSHCNALLEHGIITSQKQSQRDMQMHIITISTVAQNPRKCQIIMLHQPMRVYLALEAAGLTKTYLPCEKI